MSCLPWSGVEGQGWCWVFWGGKGRVGGIGEDSLLDFWTCPFFFFQVPLWICPDPLHLQPLPFPLRLGVRVLLGGILPRTAGGVQVELLRSVHLFRRLWGLQVGDRALAFLFGRLGRIHNFNTSGLFSDDKMVSVLEKNGRTKKAHLHWVKNSVMRWVVVTVAQQCECT